MAIDHYENFPVGSLLLPRRMRRAVHRIYRFARHADDVADEGEDSVEERLAKLASLKQELDLIQAGQPASMPLMQDLAQVIAEHQLAMQPFYDLLKAFSQDVTVTRYANFADVVDYCRFSANPVGRLMLALYGEQDSRSIALSDGICTALQLINFLQDVALDWQKGRIYLPQADLQRFRITEEQFSRQDSGGLWPTMMRLQIDRARKMLQAGAPLGKVLRGRVGLELRLIILGGERILKKLHDADGDVFRQRPVLNKRDWAYMLWRALRAK